MIKKEISIVSVIIALLYSSSFIFSHGISTYYGTPTEIIAIDTSQLLNSSYEFAFISISFSALFHLRFKSDSLSLRVKLLLGALAVFITTVPFFISSSNDYLMRNGYKGLLLNVLLLQAAIVYLVNSTSDFIENNYSYKNNVQLLLTLVCILIAFQSAGWIYANNKKNLFMDSDNKVLLASYGDKYIWGTCFKESAKFYVAKSDEAIELKKISNRDVEELKVCFMRAK